MERGWREGGERVERGWTASLHHLEMSYDEGAGGTGLGLRDSEEDVSFDAIGVGLSHASASPYPHTLLGARTPSQEPRDPWKHTHATVLCYYYPPPHPSPALYDLVLAVVCY